jgi:hypothetical protein
MTQLKKILILFLLIVISSCAGKKHTEVYEPINVFLETQKLDKNRKYVLQSNKESNKQALRIFNGGEGSDHIIDPNDPIDYTEGIFIEKHWKKMYKTYANDTIKKYWKKEDFPQYNFILEKGDGLIFKQDFLIRYMNSGINEILAISEPIYYMNKKYVMFYFEKAYFEGGGNPQVVIMKKEKDKWIIVKTIGDYIYN